MTSSGAYSFSMSNADVLIEEPMNVVYIAKNVNNGKTYIGLTTKGIKVRRRGHASSSKTENSYFYKAVRKHGIKAFEFSVLEVCRDLEHLKDRERYWIAALKPEYNTAAGGISGPQGWHHTQLSKQRMAEAKIGKPGPWRGKKRSLESIKKRTITRSANPPRYWLGKKRSPETVAKIIASRPFLPKPRPLTDEEKAIRRARCARNTEAMSKPVKCLNDGIVFPHCVAAAKHYGVAPSALRRWCNKETKSKRGLEFAYVDKAAA